MISGSIYHEAELESLRRVHQACGHHKSGSLRFGQADRLHTLWAADEQVGERLENPRRRWEESAVELTVPRKACNSLMLVGSGWASTAGTCSMPVAHTL